MKNSQLMDFMVSLHFIDTISFWIMHHYTVLHFGVPCPTSQAMATYASSSKHYITLNV
jgi:hypothetical protein